MFIFQSEGQSFVFPQIFGEDNADAPSKSEMKQMEQSQKDNVSSSAKHWDRGDLPSWFR